MPRCTFLRRFAIGAALAGAVVVSGRAHAQVDPAPTPTPAPNRGRSPDARLYFNAGARAYAAGKYPAAVRAFEEAYRIEPRPGLVFSIAQAYRRQYFIDKDRENLTLAIKHYRKYLELDPDGARRGETADALSELEPLSNKVSLSEATPVHAVLAKPATQLMISSPIEDVSISLDGKMAGTLPYIAPVSPGVHRVTLTANGYVSYEREIRVLDGSVVPLDVSLEEKRAQLTVVAPDGARITIDGRYRGVTPSATLELEPGRHFVAVTRNGHEAFAKEIAVSRGETRTLRAVLPATGQRTASWVLIGIGSTAVLAGGGLLVGALVRENSAKSTTRATEEDIRVYNDAVSSRDELRTAGIATAGAGLAVGAIGLILFAFDEPRPGAPILDEGVPERRRPRPERDPGLEVSALPWFSPGAAGAALRGGF